MKLSARDATRFISRPDASLRGVLIYGDDGAEVARRRMKLTSILSDDDDMRITRIPAADARRDGAAITDAMKARGFFAGRQVVAVEDAGDGATAAISAALEDATEDDAFLIVTSGLLPARSKLRKLFETSRVAAAAPCYGDSPDRESLREMLREFGAKDVEDGALADLEALARGFDSGAVRDLASRLALYALSEEGVVRTGHIAACAARASDAGLDEALDAIADGNAEDLGPLMARLEAQGQSPTGLAIAAGRYFRRLHMIAAVIENGGSADAAIGGLRPPVFGPRRDALIRRARRWRLAAVETAMAGIMDADDALRGGAETAGYAVLERAFLKIALTAKRFR